MRGARCFRTGNQAHPRQWAVTDEQRSSWLGAAPPRRAGAVWLSGVVARSLQTAGGYARRSRLARQPNSRQQNRNLFLNRPLGSGQSRLGQDVSRKFSHLTGRVCRRIYETEPGNQLDSAQHSVEGHILKVPPSGGWKAARTRTLESVRYVSQLQKSVRARAESRVNRS